MKKYRYMLVGGWTVIRGEKRFKPVKVVRKRISHCKSCYYYRNRFCTFYNQSCDPDWEADNCPAYWSRRKGSPPV